MTARPPLVLVPQYFGSTVFDRRTSRYLPFDSASTSVLRRLQQVPFEQVWAETPLAERDPLEAFFEHFYGLGFFTWDRRFAGEILDVACPSNHLTGPLALHLEVAAACNLTCTHCFAGVLPRKETPLTLVELDALFATLVGIGTFRIGLTGGEPLLRRDLLDILDLAIAHGLCPCLTTNGLLITEDLARELGKRPLAWLNVSLEGATAASNDLVRGPGTFDRVLEKLRVLARHARFTLAFTVLQTNVHEIRACAELAFRVGAHTAVFRPLYPVGTARHHLELMPSFGDYAAALDELLDTGVATHNLDPFSPRLRQESQSVLVDNYGCGAGTLVCSVSLSGDVNPCSFLGPEHVAHNIRQQSFTEIWNESQRFREIRSLPGDPTGTRLFGGGCRARALAFNGSINAPDPWLSQPSAVPSKIAHPLQILQVSHQTACAEVHHRNAGRTTSS